jgi:hypothetical protein
MILNDIWYVWILGRHKHKYKRINDAFFKIETPKGECVITCQQHRCTMCKKIVGLDDWQISSLPMDMLYEKIDDIN